MRFFWVLISIGVMAVVGWIASIWVGAERQREVVRWVEKQHGSYRFEHEYYGATPLSDDPLDFSPSAITLYSTPPVPQWILKYADIHFFSSVVEIDLSGAKRLDLDKIIMLKKLKRLDLYGIQIDAAQLKRLRQALPRCEIVR